MTDHPPEQAKPQRLCDHRCLLDDGHVERGEPHQYGYTIFVKPSGLLSIPSIEAGRIVLAALEADGWVDGWWISEHGSVLIALRPAPVVESST